MQPLLLKNMAEQGPGRIIYVVGPSGAGKDSLLKGAREKLKHRTDLHFIRRDITRPEDADGEDHRPVSTEEFDTNLKRGNYILHWRAHGLNYGIPALTLTALGDDDTAVISGSREAMNTARTVFPNMIVAHITAKQDTLKHRLLARGRENQAQVEGRLDRAMHFSVTGDDVIEILNEGDVAAGVEKLIAVIGGVSPLNS